MAKLDFGFTAKTGKVKSCPGAINVSYAFGFDDLSVQEIVDIYKERAAEPPDTPNGCNPRKSSNSRSPPRRFSYVDVMFTYL